MTILYYALIFIPSIILFVGGLLTVIKAGEGEKLSQYGYAESLDI